MSAGFEIAPLNMNLNVTGSLGENPGIRTMGIADSVAQPGASFSNVLSQAGSKVIDSLESAEAASVAGIKGDMGVYEVASSVMEAEQNLRMTVAVRDRLVQAFLEISRMQI